MIVKRYKMRAECMIDAARFLAVFIPARIEITGVGSFGDVDIVFESQADIDTIKGAIDQVVDGHVMLDTVALFEEYTGER